MPRIFRALFFALLITLGTATVGPAAAQITELSVFDCGTVGINCGADDDFSDLGIYAIDVINALLVLIAIIAFIAILYGGIKYLTSAGNEEDAKTAKNVILYAIIGIIVIGLAAVLVNFVAGAAGVGIAPLPGGDDLSGAILGIVNAFLVLVGIIAFIAIIYGGLKYLTSAGDEAEAKNAKNVILYAIIGILIIGIAAVTVNFVGSIAGVPTTGVPGDADLPGVILGIINAFLVLVGIIAFAYLIIGGVKYITSQGDSGSAEEAKKTILYAVIGIVVIGVAAITVNFVGNIAGVPTPGIPGGADLPTALLTIINSFLILAGVVAFAYVIIGGTKYITSQGDSGAAEEAKKTILYAVIGLVIIGLAAIAVNFVADIAGVNTTIPAGSNLPAALLLVINGFLVLVGIIALVYVIIGGVRYITSQGDSSAAEEAKKTILYAIVGMIIIGLSAVIVNFVADQAGLNTPINASPNLAAAIFFILNGFLVLAGVTALIFIIVGAVRYITSQGNSEQIDQAKRTILYAIVGLIIIGVSAVIVNFTLSIVVGEVPGGGEPQVFECSDGLDNDADGFIDGNDPDCSTPNDSSESQ